MPPIAQSADESNVGNSPIRSFVACEIERPHQNSLQRLRVEHISERLTPKGHKVISVALPLQVTFSGGALANVLPAIAQSISHALAVIVNGGSPLSNTGDGSVPSCGGLLLNLSVVGSMAYCQVPVASNWKSTARDSSALRVRTVSLRAMS